MVHAKLSPITTVGKRLWKPEQGSWIMLVQILVGSFFMGAGMFKLYNYFLSGDQTLAGHLQFWIDNNWMPEWFQWLTVHVGQPHDKFWAGAVIVAQAVPGLMLVVNKWPRIAGAILLCIQIPIFIGVLKHTNFNEFVGVSLWVCLFYVLKPRVHEQISRHAWNLLTALLFVLILLQVYNRFVHYGDHLLANVALHREHLASDVMSVHPSFKYAFLWITSLPYMDYLWVGMWYVHLLIALLIFTRWRLQAQIVNLCLWIFNEAIWMNGMTSQGALWVLALFLYVTMEQFLQMKHPDYKQSSILRSTWKEVRKIITASW